MSADRPSASVTVEVSGQRVAVRCGEIAFSFEAAGVTLPEDLDPGFVAFVLVPIAMRRGFDVAFAQPIDPVVVDNANRLAEIWSVWKPGQYTRVRLTSPPGWRRPARDRRPDLHLYSGGVDSTHTLVRRGRRDPRGHALTLRGMDYKAASDETFGRFVAKTDGLAAHLGYDRVFLRSDLVMARIDPVKHAEGSGSWGFFLASCLALFSDLFETGGISADYTEAEDLQVMSSSNHVTNRYFAGSDFRVETFGSDVSRIEKVAELARVPEALASLTFCTIDSWKPGNCGRCPKCIRTKAMFMAAAGEIPPIFADRTLTRLQLTRFNLGNVSHLLFFLQVVHTAKRNGTLGRLPGLADFVARGGSAPNRLRAMVSRILVERGLG